MAEFISAVILDLDYFLLLFTRVTALIVSSPIFGRKNIPNTAKVVFCLAVTATFYMAYPKTEDLPYTDLISYSMLVVMELLIGLAIGYVSNLFITLTFTAGQIIDMQMGFGMVNVFDVQSSGNIPVTGNLLNIILLIVFFTVNGHLRLIEILYALTERVPVGHVTLSPAIGWAATEVFIKAFILAITVAMPLIAAGILSEIGLGLIVRTVPQMNVFVVGMPVKVAMGLLMLALLVPFYVNYCMIIFDQLYISIDILFGGLT